MNQETAQAARTSPPLNPTWRCRCRKHCSSGFFFRSLFAILGKLICRQEYALFKAQPWLLNEYIIQIGARGWNSAKLTHATRGLPMRCPARSPAAGMSWKQEKSGANTQGAHCGSQSFTGLRMEGWPRQVLLLAPDHTDGPPTPSLGTDSASVPLNLRFVWRTVWTGTWKTEPPMPCLVFSFLWTDCSRIRSVFWMWGCGSSRDQARLTCLAFYTSGIWNLVHQEGI